MTTPTNPSGYEVVIHRSLVERLLLAGLPREFAIVFWTTTAALFLGMHVTWILPIAIVLHIACVALVKRDPYFFEVFLRAVKHTHRLEP